MKRTVGLKVYRILLLLWLLLINALTLANSLAQSPGEKFQLKFQTNLGQLQTVTIDSHSIIQRGSDLNLRVKGQALSQVVIQAPSTPPIYVNEGETFEIQIPSLRSDIPYEITTLTPAGSREAIRFQIVVPPPPPVQKEPPPPPAPPTPPAPPPAPLPTESEAPTPVSEEPPAELETPPEVIETPPPPPRIDSPFPDEPLRCEKENSPSSAKEERLDIDEDQDVIVLFPPFQNQLVFSKVTVEQTLINRTNFSLMGSPISTSAFATVTKKVGDEWTIYFYWPARMSTPDKVELLSGPQRIPFDEKALKLNYNDNDFMVFSLRTKSRLTRTTTVCATVENKDVILCSPPKLSPKNTSGWIRTNMLRNFSPSAQSAAIQKYHNWLRSFYLARLPDARVVPLLNGANAVLGSTHSGLQVTDLSRRGERVELRGQSKPPAGAKFRGDQWFIPLDLRGGFLSIEGTKPKTGHFYYFADCPPPEAMRPLVVKPKRARTYAGRQRVQIQWGKKGPTSEQELNLKKNWPTKATFTLDRPSSRDKQKKYVAELEIERAPSNRLELAFSLINRVGTFEASAVGTWTHHYEFWPGFFSQLSARTTTYNQSLGDNAVNIFSAGMGYRFGGRLSPLESNWFVTGQYRYFSSGASTKGEFGIGLGREFVVAVADRDVFSFIPFLKDFRSLAGGINYFPESGSFEVSGDFRFYLSNSLLLRLGGVYEVLKVKDSELAEFRVLNGTLGVSYFF